MKEEDFNKAIYGDIVSVNEVISIQPKPYQAEFEISPGWGPVWNLTYEKHFKNIPSEKACIALLIENLEADLALIKAHLEDLNEIDV